MWAEVTLPCSTYTIPMNMFTGLQHRCGGPDDRGPGVSDAVAQAALHHQVCLTFLMPEPRCTPHSTSSLQPSVVTAKHTMHTLQDCPPCFWQ